MNEKINEANPSYLIISRENETPATVNLEKGNSLFLGSGSNCKVVLEGSQIQGIHCMIWLNDEVLIIQDWNTGTTSLNGTPINTETVLNSGDRVSISDYQIIPVLDQAFHRGIASELLKNPIVPGNFETETVATPEVKSSEVTASVSLETSGTSSDEFTSEQVEALISESSTKQMGSDFEQDTTTNASAPDIAKASEPAEEPAASDAPGFTYDINADLDEEPEPESNGFNSPAFAAAASFETNFSLNPNDDLGEDEESQLLRMEVEQLRFEVAERDLQLQSLQEKSNAAKDDSESEIDDDQTLKLVNRLEDLLEELQSSDDRVRGLEELLRLSDQATQAEQEERTQLETWVTEIENRVAQRESETQAEIGRATKRLHEAQSHAKHVDSQFQKLIQAQQNIEAGAEPSEQAQALVNECRIQIEELRLQVINLTDENEELKSRPLVSDDELKASEQLKELQERLAKIEVESSCERAEMARQHAELERLRDELAEKLKSAKNIGENDSRIQAMRQHLREIHEEEKLEREERRQRSLSGRIASLLTRTR